MTEPIASLGATSAPVLLGCRRRFELAQSVAGGEGAAFSVPATLGDLCHESLQRVTETRAILGDGWEGKLADAWERSLAQRGARAPNGSNPETWPGFKVARARMRNVARRLREILMPLGKEVELICERRMTALDGRLVGKPDLVVECEGGPWIIDYKTGGVIDSETDQPRRNYVAQLQLYALLEHGRSGAWPTRGVLLPFSQRSVDVRLERGACEQLASEFKAALEKFNRGLADPQPAVPSPENCRWCAGATCCDAVWGACEESWAPEVGLALGKVAQVARSETGMATIVLDLDTGTLGEGRIAIMADPAHAEEIQSIPTGARLRVAGLRPGRGERTFSLAPWGGLRIGAE